MLGPREVGLVVVQECGCHFLVVFKEAKNAIQRSLFPLPLSLLSSKKMRRGG